MVKEAQLILAAAIDMETGMRGYLLAGDEAFLEPYEAGRVAFVERIEALQETVSDNPAQVERLRDAQATVAEWDAEVVRPMIELRRGIAGAKNMDDMRDLVAEARGKTFFDAFRGLMADFSAEEQALMVERQARNARTLATATFGLSAMAVAAVLLGLACAWIVGRAIAGPLESMTGAMSRLAEGDLSIDVEGAARRDEIGAMARATDIFKTNAREVDSSRVRAADEARAQQARAEAMAQLQASLKDAAGAAARGDFAGRVRADFDEEEFKDVARSANALFDVVERSLDEVNNVMGAVAEGDLTRSMEGRFDGAFATLQTSVNSTVARLRDLVERMRDAGAQVQRIGDDVAEASRTLSERAGQQAASLQETSATMEELSATVKSNADSASEADALAAGASRSADDGGRIVAQAVAAMEEIERGSAEAVEIISTIDSIAFQTNLLALNAAVEAARAGAAGKGFAVVASEVRTLAQSSAGAAKEIRELIERSARQVGDGAGLVKSAGDALSDIVAGIRKVESAVADISSASREQTAAVTEVTDAVGQMDLSTQESAGMAEQTAGGAARLLEARADLDGLIGFFRLEGHGETTTNAAA